MVSLPDRPHVLYETDSLDRGFAVRDLTGCGDVFPGHYAGSGIAVFYLGAFYAFTVWIRKGGTAFVLTAALFTALAISLKVPTVFVGIPMLFMAAAKFKGKWS